MAMDLKSFFKTATKEQKSLLYEIATAAEEEDRLATEVKDAFDSLPSHYAELNRMSSNKDSACTHAMTLWDNLIKLRRQIEGYMKKAVKLGMRDLTLIDKHYESYVEEL